MVVVGCSTHGKMSDDSGKNDRQSRRKLLVQYYLHGAASIQVLHSPCPVLGHWLQIHRHDCCVVSEFQCLPSDIVTFTG